MSKEKCCADCKHCVIKSSAFYACDKTVTTDRITGRLRYDRCQDVIDTRKCEFVDISGRRNVTKLILMLIGIGLLFFSYWYTF